MKSQYKKWKTIKCGRCGADSRIPSSPSGNPGPIGKRTLAEFGWQGSSHGLVCPACANELRIERSSR